MVSTYADVMDTRHYQKSTFGLSDWLAMNTLYFHKQMEPVAFREAWRGGNMRFLKICGFDSILASVDDGEM